MLMKVRFYKNRFCIKTKHLFVLSLGSLRVVFGSALALLLFAKLRVMRHFIFRVCIFMESNIFTLVIN